MRLELRARIRILLQGIQFRMKLRNLFFAFVLGTALAAGIWAAMSLQRPAPAPITATVLPMTADLPAFSLLDHEGRNVDQHVFEGQWDLVFFGFTNCPDICPLTLQVLSAAKRQLEEQGQSPLPRIVLVSVDPERDTPARMAQYVNAFGDGNLGITGELDELRKLTSGLGIFFEKHESDGESYAVDHSSVVLVIDPAGNLHSLFSGPHVIENFVHDLPLLMTSIEEFKPPLVAAELEITRAMPGMSVSAAYITLTNNSYEEIRITHVTSPQFGAVELHQTTIENDVARMRAVDELIIRPGETVRLERGSMHLMLMRQAGDADTVTLNFHSGDRILMSVSAPLSSSGD